MKKLISTLLVALVLTCSLSFGVAPVFATAITTESGAVVAPEGAATPAPAMNPGSTVVIAAEDKEGGEINFAGLVTGFAIAAYSIFAFIAVGLFKLLKKIPLFNSYFTQEKYNELVNPLLNDAIAWGVGELEKADWLKVETKNAAVANAVNYVLEHGGDLLEKFGITQEMLKQKLEAKLVANGWDKKPGEWADKNAGVQDQSKPGDVAVS